MSDNYYTMYTYLINFAKYCEPNIKQILFCLYIFYHFCLYIKKTNN